MRRAWRPDTRGHLKNMESIQEIVTHVLKDISGQRLSFSTKIQEIWDRILDPREQKHSRIEEFQNGTLMVCVDSSAWLFQMNFKKRKILTALQKDIPGVKKILFKLGKIS